MYAYVTVLFWKLAFNNLKKLFEFTCGEEQNFHFAGIRNSRSIVAMFLQLKIAPLEWVGNVLRSTGLKAITNLWETSFPTLIA